MAKAAKAPWMKWYPADWRQEPTLRLCSRAARCLWVDMLCLMHEGEPYGHLTVNNRPLSAKQLAAVLGDAEKDVVGWLAELEENAVLSRTDARVIFSRRMVKDKAREDRNRANGQGGGNPKLKAQDNREDEKSVNPPDKAEVKSEVKAQKPEARSQKPIPESLVSEDKKSEAKTEDDWPDLPGFMRADLRPRFESVKGGAKRFAGIGERPFKPKDPDRADADVVKHLTTHCAMDAGSAWLLVAAARNPDDPKHSEAARICEKHSREHKLGWFHMEAAE
jgi:hypothetical protein